jgi:ribose 1,5-bisphosphokinase PhnN
VLNRLKPWLYRHYGWTFVLMGLSFLAFGILSLNLIYLIKANIELFLDYGTMVIADGALRQLLELLVYGYLSLAFYLLFKACEHILVIRLTEDGPADHEP